MKAVKAKNIDEIYQKLSRENCREVIIDFDISADEFFRLSGYWCERGARIKKTEDKFMIRMAKVNLACRDPLQAASE